MKGLSADMMNSTRSERGTNSSVRRCCRSMMTFVPGVSTMLSFLRSSLGRARTKRPSSACSRKHTWHTACTEGARQGTFDLQRMHTMQHISVSIHSAVHTAYAVNANTCEWAAMSKQWPIADAWPSLATACRVSGIHCHKQRWTGRAAAGNVAKPGHSLQLLQSV